MVKANVDRMLDVLRERKSISINELSQILSISKEDIMKSAEYLEEDEVIKIERKFPKTNIILVKDPDSLSQMPMPPLPNEAQQKTRTQDEYKAENGLAQDEKTVQENNAQNSSDNSFEFKELPQTANPEEFKPGVGYVDKSEARQEKRAENKNFTFLLDESSGNAPSKEKVSSPVSLRESSSEGSEEISDPLEPKPPSFRMEAPLPMKDNRKTNPNVNFDTEIIMKPEESFPDYVKSGLDKIEYLIEDTNKRITNHDYRNLNARYRQIFTSFQETDLSPNERYILGEKLNELFHRVKRIYLIESNII